MTLQQVQQELKAPKSQYNSYGGFHYRSCDDILQAVKPLLLKHGDNLYLTDEPVLVGDWHYIKATAVFVDKDENKIAVNGYAREALSKKGMDTSQITGTASSYARKYALDGLFLIDDTKDADTDEYQKQNRRARQKPLHNNRPQQKQSEAQLFEEKKTEYFNQVKKLIKMSGFSTKEITDVVMHRAGLTEKAKNINEMNSLINTIQKYIADYERKASQL